MKLTFGFLMVLAIGVRAQKPENIFQRTFRRLHEEPPLPPPLARNRANVQTLYIEQKLDHFNEADERTWQMRYVSNDEFYVEGGPFFINVGGEWDDISSQDVTRNHIYDMAKENSGYLFCTEHRYYGQSRPVSVLSVENLKYLTVRQALADLAHFIRTMRATLPGAVNSKVILLGGSYSGTMVTWFKREYPDLATGCWASSAPLFAQVNLQEPKENIGEITQRVGGTDCYNRIQNGITEIRWMLANEGVAKVKATLNICDNFDENSGLDLWMLFSKISDIFKDLEEQLNETDIQEACQEIMAGHDDFTGLVDYLATELYCVRCNDFSVRRVNAAQRNITYDIGLWQYQLCNEFGWFVRVFRKTLFGTEFPVPSYSDDCSDYFGDEFSDEAIIQKVTETNEHFGGFNPDVKNVYFTYGELEIWRQFGIQEGEMVTVLPNADHISDVGSISDDDTFEMRASKEKIAALVRQWLKDDEHNDY